MALRTSAPATESVGNYELVEKIADGGMGTVYRARERGTGRTVALKLVAPHTAANAVLMKRFEKEYSAAKALDHPNIVRALDFGCHEQSPYLVMEFIEGESLGQRLEREGRIPEAEAIDLITQVAQGLHKAHKLGLIHRDVKPDNILVTKDGTAKLTDLGLVKEMDAELSLTRTGRGLGTPFFMAPEQFRNAKNADARCDIYSLAATLYMMVTGEMPFKSYGPLDAWIKKVNNELKPARELVPALSERTDWAIRRAMSADPNQRPQNCREFVEDLTGHSTREITPLATPREDESWHLLYRDDDGVVHTVQGASGAIRRMLRAQLLGDASQVRASRCKEGPFELLRHHPEFRDLVVEPGKPVKTALPAKPPTPPRIQRAGTASAGSGSTSPSTSSGVLQPPSSVRVSAPAASALEQTVPIHILLTVSPPPSGGWLRWLLLGLAATATGAVGYVLLPLLLRLRLF